MFIECLATNGTSTHAITVTLQSSVTISSDGMERLTEPVVGIDWSKIMSSGIKSLCDNLHNIGKKKNRANEPVSMGGGGTH